MVGSSKQSHWPYQGDADRYWNVGQPTAELRDVAWSYSTPLPAVAEIAGRLAFYNELVDITVDGEVQDRPVSHFSAPANRPRS